MMLFVCGAQEEEVTNGFLDKFLRQTGPVSYDVRERDTDTVHRRHSSQLCARAVAEPETEITKTHIAQKDDCVTPYNDVVSNSDAQLPICRSPLGDVSRSTLPC